MYLIQLRIVLLVTICNIASCDSKNILVGDTDLDHRDALWDVDDIRVEDSVSDSSISDIFTDTIAADPTDSVDTIFDDITLDGDACIPVTAAIGGSCNIVENCGCAPGSWCSHYSDLSDCSIVEYCRASLPGILSVESDCDTNSPESECTPGTVCMTDGPGSPGDPGHCYEYCLSDDDCSIVGRTCSIELDLSLPPPCGSVAAPFHLCAIDSM